MRVEGGSCQETWPGAARAASAVSRVRAPWCQPAFPGQHLQPSSPPPPPRPRPRTHCLFAAGTPISTVLLIHPTRTVENWGRSCFPADLRVAPSQVAPKSFTSFGILDLPGPGGALALLVRLCVLAGLGRGYSESVDATTLATCWVVSALTLGGFHLLTNLMKVPVLGATDNSGKQKESTCLIIVGNDVMMCKFAVCICIL